MALVTLLLTARHSLKLYPVRWELVSLSKGSGMLRLGVAFTLAGIVGSGAEMFIRSFLNVIDSLDAVGLYNAGYMITITYGGLVFAAMESDYFPRLSAVNQDVEATNLIKALTLPVAYITLARGYSFTYLVLETAYFVILVVLVILGYRHWGIWGTGLAITLAHLAEYLIINGYARWRYQYKQSSAIVKYGAVHLLIGLLAYILTTMADKVAYWLLGGVLIVVSLSFSLWVLNQKRKSSSTSTRL